MFYLDRLLYDDACFTDDILALLKRRPMTIEEVAKKLKRTESDVLIQLYGELKGLVKMESGGKWKHKTLTNDGQ